MCPTPIVFICQPLKSKTFPPRIHGAMNPIIIVIRIAPAPAEATTHRATLGR
jgi:hypothetical protein